MIASRVRNVPALASAPLKTLLVIALLLGTSRAFAHLQYPELVRDDLALRRAPECTLCHTTETGRKGTAKKKFVSTLHLLGVPDAYAPDKLAMALGELDACAVDTDGDEIPDTEEIRSGSDPSDGPARQATTECGVAAGGAGGAGGRIELEASGDGEVFTGPLPQHGCAFAPGDSPWSSSLVGLAAALVLARRVARRLGRPQPASR